MGFHWELVRSWFRVGECSFESRRSAGCGVCVCVLRRRSAASCCGGRLRRRAARVLTRVPCPCALLLSTTHIPLTRAAHPAPPATESAAPVTPPPLRPGRPAPGPHPPRRLPPRYFPKFFPAAPKGAARQVHPTERVRGPARKAEFAAAPLAAAAPLWPVNPCVFPSCGPRVGLP